MNERLATEDLALSATIVSRRTLWYDAGPDPRVDRPAHVRAASGAAWARVDGRDVLVVAQDDASFLALVDPSSGRVASVTLDHQVGGRRQFDAALGNKREKLDLESCCALDLGGRSVVLALGSGSAAGRDRLVAFEPEARRARLVDARTLYARLRGCVAFAGSELNVEGATCWRGDLVLAQRGNGAPHGGLAPVDATCTLSVAALGAWIEDPSREPPVPRDVTRWDLGSIEGVRLTFTDLAAVGDHALGFLAAAEASPNAIDDGVVAGVAIGWIDARGARWVRIREADGSACRAKVEGLAWDPSSAGRRAFLVVDRDDPSSPAELVTVEIEARAVSA